MSERFDSEVKYEKEPEEKKDEGLSVDGGDGGWVRYG